MTPFVRLFPLLPALCLAACSGTGGDTAGTGMSADPVAVNRIKTGDLYDDDFKEIQKKYGDFNPKVGKDGELVEGQGKQFEGFDRENPEFKGRWNGKEYKGGDYKKRSAWGDKDYVTKVYGGNTDGNSIRKDSRFDNRSAGENTVAARDANKSYKTDAYATGAAREQGGKGISKSSDAETDERRRVFTEPDIIPWRSQGMTVEDTKRMMGR